MPTPSRVSLQFLQIRCSFMEASLSQQQGHDTKVLEAVRGSESVLKPHAPSQPSSCSAAGRWNSASIAYPTSPSVSFTPCPSPPEHRCLMSPLLLSLIQLLPGGFAAYLERMYKPPKHWKAEAVIPVRLWRPEHQSLPWRYAAFDVHCVTDLGMDC